VSLPPSLLEFAAGDEAAARLMHDNLRALSDRLAGSPDQAELRRDVDAVLAGRMSLRDLADLPAFRDLVDDGMRQAHEAWQQLDPEERQALVRDGTEILARTRPGD
jgi:hypothetical protein